MCNVAHQQVGMLEELKLFVRFKESMQRVCSSFPLYNEREFINPRLHVKFLRREVS